MGIAAYHRGSRLISEQIRRELGDTSMDRPKPPPSPRPPQWGQETRTRAERWGRGFLTWLRSRGHKDPTVEELATAIREHVRIGKRPALSVASTVLSQATEAGANELEETWK